MKGQLAIQFLISVLGLSVLCCGQNGINLYNEGASFLNEGQYHEALEKFELGIKANDASISANRYGKAYSLFELGEIDDAQVYVEKALELESINSSSINSQSYWLLAMISEEKGDIKTETSSFEKALKYAPDDHFLKASYGLALIEAKQVESGIKILTQVLDIDKNDPFALSNRAFGYIQIGQYSLAKVDLDRSSKYDDENPFLHRNYFMYYRAQNEFERACSSLRTALNKDMVDYGSKKDTENLSRMLTESCEGK